MKTPLTDLVSKRLSDLLVKDWSVQDFYEIVTEKILFDVACEQVMNSDSFFRDRLVEIGFYKDENISCTLTTDKYVLWTLKGSKGSLELSIGDVIEQLNVK